MNEKLLNDNGQKTYALILESGEEAMSALRGFAESHDIHSAQFTAIGAFSRATVGFYDFGQRDYINTEFKEQVEVLSINGDVSRYEGQVKVHAHTVLGRKDASTRGGHLLEGIVHPTLEVILTESPAWLEREMDEASGIPLIRTKPSNP